MDYKNEDKNIQNDKELNRLKDENYQLKSEIRKLKNLMKNMNLSKQEQAKNYQTEVKTLDYLKPERRGRKNVIRIQQGTESTSKEVIRTPERINRVKKNKL